MSQRITLYYSILIITVLLLTGCDPARSNSPAIAPASAAQPQAAIAMLPTVAPPQPVEDSSQEGSPAQGNDSAAQQRVVLKNATLTLTVADPRLTVTQVTQLAEGMGGWVVASNATTTVQDGKPFIQAVISVRVPAEQFASALEQIKSQAVSVDTENITGDDVTQKYVDLTSQLTNLEATSAQLQKIMGTATNVNDVLTVQSKLTDVQGQIEVIKGQLKYYSDAAAYSLISLTLVQKQAPPTPTPTPAPKSLGLADWHPDQTAKAAADTLVSAGQMLLTVLIWLIILGGPIVVPIALVWYALRRWQRRTGPRLPDAKPD